MPTGYTYPVVDGKITDFPTFALFCARAFGALITMRDDAMDATIPDEIKPETKYYDERLAEAKKRLGEVQAMTDSQCAGEAEKAHGEALLSRRRYLEKQELEAERINAMLYHVRAWHPPTPDHTEMKRFMIEQLTMSLPGKYAPEIPALLDGATWRQETIDALAEEVVRHQKKIDEEIQRAAGRTKWLQDLRGSLTVPSTERC